MKFRAPLAKITSCFILLVLYLMSTTDHAEWTRPTSLILAKIISCFILLAFYLMCTPGHAESTHPTSLIYYWDAVPGAVHHYDVYASMNKEVFKKVGETAGTTPEYRLENLKPGATYRVKVQAADSVGNTGPFSDISDPITIPQTFQKPSINFTQLLQNYPNPFNPETWIPFQLRNGAAVTITIYNCFGNEVKMLEMGLKEAGYYHTKDSAAYWDGTNKFGEPVSSGLYFYTIKAGDFRSTRRMLVVK